MRKKFSIDGIILTLCCALIIILGVTQIILGVTQLSQKHYSFCSAKRTFNGICVGDTVVVVTSFKNPFMEKDTSVRTVIRKEGDYIQYVDERGNIRSSNMFHELENSSCYNVTVKKSK